MPNFHRLENEESFFVLKWIAPLTWKFCLKKILLREIWNLGFVRAHVVLSTLWFGLGVQSWPRIRVQGTVFFHFHMLFVGFGWVLILVHENLPNFFDSLPVLFFVALSLLNLVLYSIMKFGQMGGLGSKDFWSSRKSRKFSILSHFKFKWNFVEFSLEVRSSLSLFILSRFYCSDPFTCSHHLLCCSNTRCECARQATNRTRADWQNSASQQNSKEDSSSIWGQLVALSVV